MLLFRSLFLSSYFPYSNQCVQDVTGTEEIVIISSRMRPLTLCSHANAVLLLCTVARHPVRPGTAMLATATSGAKHILTFVFQRHVIGLLTYIAILPEKNLAYVQ